MPDPARNRRGRRDATTVTALLIAAALQAPTQHFAPLRMDVGDVVVLASPEHEALGTDLAEAAAATREWQGLGRVDLTPLTLVLAPDANAFAEWSRGRVPRWGAGMTIPNRRLIVIRVDAGDPFGTLRHELAHLAFHLTVSQRVPLWFSEGYAVVASGELSRFAELQVNLAVALGRVPSLAGLERALRGEAGAAGAAYALSGVAVSEVARRHPTGTLKPIIDRLIEGEPFPQALLAATGLDPEAYGEAWHRAVRQRYNLGVWVLAGGGWMLLVVVLAVGSAWRRRRDAPRRAALDEGWAAPEDDEGVESR